MDGEEMEEKLFYCLINCWGTALSDYLRRVKISKELRILLQWMETNLK